MNTFVTIVGWLCLLFICLGVLCGAVSIVAMLVAKALERFEWAIVAQTRRSVGRSLHSSSHWFGESPDAALVVKIIGSRLINSDSIDADSMREQWRKARPAQGEQS